MVEASSVVASLNEVMSSRPGIFVINGEVLKNEGSPVFAYRDDSRGYQTKYFCRRGNEIVPIENGERLIFQAYSNFMERYDGFISNEQTDTEVMAAERDDFAGAYLQSTRLYTRLMDPELHKTVTTYSKELQPLMEDFIVQQLINYFELFLLRYNRKLMSASTPIKNRAHFIEGLFQPYTFTSTKIPCPIEWGRFDWFRERWNANHVVLESGASNKGYHLTCVAMSDFCDSIGIPVVTQFDRKHFQCIVGGMLAQSVASDGMSRFMSYFPYQPLFYGQTKEANLLGTLLKTYTRKLRQPEQSGAKAS